MLMKYQLQCPGGNRNIFSFLTKTVVKIINQAWELKPKYILKILDVIWYHHLNRLVKPNKTRSSLDIRPNNKHNKVHNSKIKNNRKRPI